MNKSNDSKIKLRIVGDCHGKYQKHLDLIKEAEYSIQLGDYGFNCSYLNSVCPIHHKILAGNHDNYEEKDGKFILQTPHFLGDFGVYTVPDYGDFFFIRGGYSIDWKYRKEGRDWWPKEQLSYAQGMEALKLYEAVKPDFVISHECPASMIPNIIAGIGRSQVRFFNGVELRPSMTANLLDSMWELHKPSYWVHGHHHFDYEKTINGTKFIGVGELKIYDL